MGLLVAFFVMLVAFSTQDSAKLQIVAGSMREAFGVQQNVRYSGIIEVDGLPTRPRLRPTPPRPTNRITIANTASS
jgi:chemotaxis protein MotB